MKKSSNIELPPAGVETVVLHTCCAPCSSAIIEWMLNNRVTPIIFYCNPNIWPDEEYLKRKDECSRYARELGLEIVDADYDHNHWLQLVKGLENEPERGSRCQRCFDMRLDATAKFALERGLKVITTTLASSRWKSLDQINAAGHRAEQSNPGIIFWDRNWRKGGLNERRAAIIRERDFYRQRYCGCEFSFNNSVIPS